MASARSIASLTLSFGLVNVPVRLYSASESGAAVRFNMLAKDGSRVKQQYVSEKTGKVVPRNEMVKGYEFEKDHFVVFRPEELEALEEGASHVVEIVAFIPERSVDPLYFDKAYLLAPDKRGGKPYKLLLEAMRASGRCALARWSWKSKQYVVQIRPAEGGLVLQQLLYADEVRLPAVLDIEDAAVSPAELKLALQLIEQIAEPGYQPDLFVDEERARVLAAIDQKIAGKEIVAATRADEVATGGQVIDLMQALQASLGRKATAKAAGTSGKAGKAPADNVTPLGAAKGRKTVQHVAKAKPQAEPSSVVPRGRARR